MSTDLTPRGDIAIAEIVVYAIFLVISIFNCVRHGFKRQDGWIFLAIFCILRIVASVLVIVVETSSNPSVGLIVAELTVSNIALTPLHMAALGFLTTCARLTFDDVVPQNLAYLLRIVRLALIAAIVLGIVSASELSSNSLSGTGHDLQKASVLLITAVFAFLTVFSLYLLGFTKPVGHSRMLTLALTVTLPFLFVRVLYSILSVFLYSSANDKFNSATGSWQIYLGMDVIMEFVVVGVLAITGLLLGSYYRKDVSRPSEYSEFELDNRK
ncbi:hypothetical protein V1509DRAFT_632625 [Lipomyces kononenkoae]